MMAPEAQSVREDAAADRSAHSHSDHDHGHDHHDHHDHGHGHGHHEGNAGHRVSKGLDKPDPPDHGHGHGHHGGKGLDKADPPDHGHGHGHGHHGGHSSREIIEGSDEADRHDHGHGHHDEHDKRHRDDVQRRLKLASVLCLIFLVSEIAGGLVSGSLAVLSDAAHLFSDFMGFVFAVAAGYMASLPGSSNYTFGYRRWEVVAALFSMCSLAVCTVFLEVEGIRRLVPYVTGDVAVIEEVDGKIMSIIASIGVVINISLALILGVENHVHMPGDDHHHDHDHGHGHGHDGHARGGHDHEYSAIQMVASSGSDLGGNHDHHSHHDHGDHHDDDHHHKHHNHHDHHDDHDHDHHDHDDHDDHDHHNHHDHDDHHDHHDHLEEVDIGENSRDHHPFAKEERPKKKENINLRAAYLHVLGDLVQSIAVLAAGLVIMYKPEWSVVDPILSVIFCPLIFYSTLGVIRTSMRILLEGAPADVRADELWSSIAAAESVTRVTNLHVWSISHGTVAATVHARSARPQTALHEIHGICTNAFSIDHCTIQVEDDSSKKFISNPESNHFYAPVDSGYGLV